MVAGPTAHSLDSTNATARVLFERYAGRVKYWLTFNEINSVLHFPFMSGGIPGKFWRTVYRDFALFQRLNHTFQDFYDPASSC